MKKIFLFIYALVIGFISINSVQAANITEDKISNVFANQNYKGNELSATFGYMYADGTIAYCIDPGIPLKIGSYEKTYDFSYKNIDKSKKEKLELIAYYGYQYPGHNTEKYYYATQALIWETIGSTNVSFTTARYRGGNIIDINFEKQQIMNLVNKFLLFPSFANSNIEGFLGDKLTLADSNNNYLSFYYISSNKNSFNFANGNFNIELNELGEGQIKITNKLVNNKNSAIYYSSGYQSLVTLGVNVIKEASINILVNDPNRIKLKINNYDSEDGRPLINSAFKIKNIDTNEYLKENDEEIFYTNSEGFLIFSNYINSGSYQIEQISVNDNYIINNNNVIFVVNEDTKTVELNGVNYIIIDYYNDKVNTKTGTIDNDLDSNQNNNFEKLPKTSSRYSFMNVISIFILIISSRVYYETKNNKEL